MCSHSIHSLGLYPSQNSCCAHTKKAWQCHSDQGLNWTHLDQNVEGFEPGQLHHDHTESVYTNDAIVQLRDQQQKPVIVSRLLTLHLDYAWTIIVLLPDQQTVAEVKRFV